MASLVPDATSKVHAILEPLSSDERYRVTQAALIMLGDSIAAPKKPADTSGSGPDVTEGEETEDLPPAAKRWMKKHKLDSEALEQYFHFEVDSVKPIGLAGDGTSKRRDTINTYLMQGVAALLQTGDPKFSDGDARQLCTEFGCYDTNNHSSHLGKFGNLVTGSKKNGWKLTAPGLTEAAKLIIPAEE